ncbi:MAG: hypothetical protein V2I33_23750 [Kangiellaceae bacterium]|nr:hypothetical protein [Kangiellaceae bacterium]
MTGEAYEFCLAAAPTGKKDTPWNNVPADASRETPELSYMFNVPTNVYANSGVAGEAFDLTGTIDGASGYPVKQRGVNFDGNSNGYIKLETFVFNHTFSIHAWVLINGLGKNTLFSRDKSDYDGGSAAP